MSELFELTTVIDELPGTPQYLGDSVDRHILSVLDTFDGVR